MKTIKTGILLLFVSSLLSSCGIDMMNRIEGDRNVVKENRKVNAAFSKVKASSGLDVFISQGDELSIEVEADENLQEVIKTEINDGRLRIYANKNIWRAKARKVYVTVKDLESLEASSGSDVYSQGVLKVQDIVVSASSGADMKIELNANSVDASSSSGSDLKLSGKTVNFYGSSSSGSSTNAWGLESQYAKVKSSSGADLSIHVTESLEAKTSSGGDIRYKGNPKKLTKTSSSGGSVKSRS